jgi:hypothetical protein
MGMALAHLVNLAMRSDDRELRETAHRVNDLMQEAGVDA